jgi:tetratricopeptide (TPR) repeat protein
MKVILSIILILFVGNLIYAQKSISNKEFEKALELQKENKYTEAIDLYKEILSKKNVVFEAYYNRGMCYLAINENKLALNDFKIAISAFDKDLLLNHMMAAAYMLLNDYGNAVLYFDKSLNYGLVLTAYEASHIGTCYYFNQQPDSAKRYFNITIAKDKNNIRALTNLGWIYLEEGSFNDAKDMFERCLSIEKNNPNYLNNLGLAYFKLGNIDKGFELISKSKELDENNAFVFRNLALIYKYKGDKEKSCFNYQKALELNIVQNWGEKYVEELIEYCK